MENKHLGSVFDNESDLIKALIKIHNENKDIELDATYFKGNFYKNGINSPKLKFDINPQFDNVVKGNAENLPLNNNSINCMMIDLPFMFGNRKSQQKYYSSNTHGIYQSFDDLYISYENVLKESYRILKKKGILFFKCQDYTDNHTTITHCIVYLLATKIGFYAKDLAILHLPKNKIANNKLTQKHLRKHHSYFWVFIKT